MIFNKASIFFSMARVFRKAPNFKGKYFVGRNFRDILKLKEYKNNCTEWIDMKGGFSLFLDVRNDTDLVAIWCGVYDTMLIEKFMSNFEDNWTILDVGANVGYYSIPFSLEKSEQTILAFEPVYENYQTLIKAKKFNNCQNLKHYNLALGAYEAKVEMAMLDATNTGNAVIRGNRLDNSTQEVRVTDIQMSTLDKFYEINSVSACDFIKVDIEGYELNFLEGATKTIKKYRPVIYGEFNPFFLKQNKRSSLEVCEYFDQIDYYVYKLRPGKYYKNIKFELILDPRKGLQDLLLIPKETPPEKIKSWIS